LGTAFACGLVRDMRPPRAFEEVSQAYRVNLIESKTPEHRRFQPFGQVPIQSRIERTFEMTRNKIAPCLWFDGRAREAAEFYAATFPDSHVGARLQSPADYPAGKQGDELTVEFTVLGMPFLGLNAGSRLNFNEAVSFQVYTDTQDETDRYWNAIVENGGEESQCGWCKDKFGLSWQIVPRVLLTAMADPDRAAAKRAMEAMMGMRKIDIAAIEAAHAGRAVA